MYSALHTDCCSVMHTRHLPVLNLAVPRVPVRDACVNDLEAPAFTVMPELAQLKERLAGEGLYDAVFMTGAAQHAPWPLMWQVCYCAEQWCSC